LEATGEADYFLHDFVACFPFVYSAFCLSWMVFGKRLDVDFDNKNFCDQKHVKNTNSKVFTTQIMKYEVSQGF